MTHARPSRPENRGVVGRARTRSAERKYYHRTGYPERPKASTARHLFQLNRHLSGSNLIGIRANRGPLPSSLGGIRLDLMRLTVHNLFLWSIQDLTQIRKDLLTG